MFRTVLRLIAATLIDFSLYAIPKQAHVGKAYVNVAWGLAGIIAAASLALAKNRVWQSCTIAGHIAFVGIAPLAKRAGAAHNSPIPRSEFPDEVLLIS